VPGPDIVSSSRRGVREIGERVSRPDFLRRIAVKKGVTL
jgi:hypothetical protein